MAADLGSKPRHMKKRDEVRSDYPSHSHDTKTMLVCGECAEEQRIFLKGRIEALEAKLAAQSWVSVSERLPEESGYYLVFVPAGAQFAPGHWHISYFRGNEWAKYKLELTHWKHIYAPPLPTAPEGENE